MKNEDIFSTYAYYLSAVSAGYIFDRYKKVRELNFKLEFNDPLGKTPPLVREFKRGPEDSALFFFKCPLEDCLDGGYNLNDLVFHMITDERMIFRGEMTCRGRHCTAGRKDACQGNLRYEIRAVYDDRTRKGILDWLGGIYPIANRR